MPQPDGVIERHFTATAYIVAAGHVLLLWHQALGMWLPPGGHCEPNEDPVQAAEREAEEEAGVPVAVIRPPGLIEMNVPRVLPPPAVILVEDIVRADQPFHQHIDCIYFTRPVDAVDRDAPIPHGPHAWVTREQLAGEFSLPVPGGSLVGVAEDVRLLGVQAIDAAAATE
ncbi:MAG: NUDIX domain-containing protein [Dehalococcoidia bacterium]|nr:NUDIX domain-containing protein [Dehalococcoidia bacterium]